MSKSITIFQFPQFIKLDFFALEVSCPPPIPTVGELIYAVEKNKNANQCPDPQLGLDPR